MIPEKTIIRGLMGSHSVGCATPESDLDYMEVVLGSEDNYLGLEWWGDQGTKESKTLSITGAPVETTCYELKKFLRLCKNFNPNVIPLLYLDNYELLTEEGELLVQNRGMFSSKLAVTTFSAYALGQLKKMQEPATGHMGSKRKALREKHGYDTKYAYHTIRLQHTLLDFIRSNGVSLPIRRTYDLEYLKMIRNGEFSLNYILTRGTENDKLIKELVINSAIPDSPDKQKIREVCRTILRKHLELT